MTFSRLSLSPASGDNQEHIEKRLTSVERAVRGQRVLAIALMVVGWSTVAVSKDMALVSNKTNTVTTVSLAELVKICKGQTNRWPDGRPVTVVIRDPASTEMKLVVEKVYALPKDEVSALITAANHGRVNHPAIVITSSDEDLVKKVESTPGAVGLVDVYSITGGVTVLRVGGKLPLEPGYALHGN
jgi:ABC-type phosphate transport system substrate-binding protein